MKSEKEKQKQKINDLKKLVKKLSKDKNEIVLSSDSDDEDDDENAFKLVTKMKIIRNLSYLKIKKKTLIYRMLLIDQLSSILY